MCRIAFRLTDTQFDASGALYMLWSFKAFFDTNIHGLELAWKCLILLTGDDLFRIGSCEQANLKSML